MTTLPTVWIWGDVMYKINEDMSIECTRGDAVLLDVEAIDQNGEKYEFQPGETIRFKVYKKKRVTDVVLSKEFRVTETRDDGSKTVVQVYLSGEDTKFDRPVNKPTDFWYEVVLNEDDANKDKGPQTIIGYTIEEGPKIFRLLPEGVDE